MAALEMKYKRAFKDADTSGDDKISVEEFVRVMEDMGKNNTPSECQRWFNKVDVDKSGSIDETEFLKMMFMIDNAWITVQTKTFTRWCNTVLSEVMLKIDTLAEDLKDGTKLAPLIEVLSGRKVGKINKKPRMKLHRQENLNKSLEFLKNDNIPLVNIGAEDLEGGNLKITLGLIWTLILRYQITGDTVAEGSPKWELLEWVRKQIAPYNLGIELKNFKKGWSDGRVLSALTDSLEPGCVDMNNMNPEPIPQTQVAMDTAEEKFEIPKVMDAEDIVDTPDEMSIMTYVSYFRDWQKNHADKEAAKKKATPVAAFCIAYGPGLEGGFNNQPCKFTIEARNCFDEKIPRSNGEVFDIQVTGPSEAKVSQEDNGDGIHPCEYMVAVPGTYTVNITLNGEPIKEGVREVQINGPVAENCTASGPGVEGGDARDGQADFVITAKNDKGEPLANGGDNFEIKATGPDGNPVDVQTRDNGDGTYSGSYPVEQPGDYVVDISLLGEPIKDSAFTARMELGNPGLSWADGDGLKEGKTGNPAQFVIHAVDKDGNPVPFGGDPFKAKVTGPTGEEEVPLVDNKDGTYSGEYFPQEEGDYVVDLTLHGDPIKDNPFTASVKRAPDASASYCDGPGFDKACDNAPTSFTVHACDKDGKPVSGDECEVTIKPKDPSSGLPDVPCEIKDNGDGTYTVDYNAPEAGDYVLDVKLDDESVKDVPKDLKVTATQPDAGNCIAYGPGLEGGFNNEPLEFTIEARNKFDEKLETSAGEVFDITVTGPETVEVEQSDNGDGIHPCKYQVTLPGVYTVTIALNGEPIKDGVRQVEITGPSAGNSTASGPGVEGGDSRKGGAEFLITAITGDGKPVGHGGDKYECKITSPSGEQIPAEVDDNGDGTYAGLYPVDGPGDYTVEITLLGEHIKNSPFKARMEAGNPALCYAEGDGLKKGKTDVPAEFKIFSVDGDGKPVECGGDPFVVDITGPNGKIEPDMKDNGDGTYSVAYTPDVEGDYTVDVTLHGEPIKDNPFAVKIKRSPDASKCYCKGKGFDKAYDNRKAKFKVYVFDKDGKAVSGDDCVVSITPEDAGAGLDEVKADVVDNGDGTYSVEYSPEQAGNFVIDVTIDGERVKDVPKTIKVREGADCSKMGYGKFKFTIKAVNKRGELKEEGGDDFFVQICDPEGNEIDHKAKDNGDGSYSAEYKLGAPKGGEGPVEATEYTVNVMINEEHIPGSPFKQFM